MTKPNNQRKNKTMKATNKQNLLAAALVGALACTTAQAQTAESTYKFERGYPTAETVKQAYDDGDLNRAIQAYRFFYPPISMAGFLRGFETQGTQDNKPSPFSKESPTRCCARRTRTRFTR
jgi:hypothetical protein